MNNYTSDLIFLEIGIGNGRKIRIITEIYRKCVFCIYMVDEWTHKVI